MRDLTPCAEMFVAESMSNLLSMSMLYTGHHSSLMKWGHSAYVMVPCGCLCVCVCVCQRDRDLPMDKEKQAACKKRKSKKYTNDFSEEFQQGIRKHNSK